MEPQQDRSRQSRDRLLDEAGRLLAEQGYERTSVRAICRGAGLTTGAFYARFESKEAMARGLVATLELELGEALAAGRHGERGLDDNLRALYEATVELYQRHGALLRSLLSMASAHPGVARALRELNDRTFGHALAELAGRLRMTGDADRKALEFAVFVGLNTLRELVLEQRVFERGGPAEEPHALVEELVAMASAYLRSWRRRRKSSGAGR